MSAVGHDLAVLAAWTHAVLQLLPVLQLPAARMRLRRSPRPTRTVEVAPPAPPTGDLLSRGGGADQVPRPLLPRWLVRAAAYGAVLLVLAAVLWLVVTALLEVALAAFALIVAVLLVALAGPPAGWLRRHGVPSVLAALLSLLVLVGVPVAVVLLVVDRVVAQADEFTEAITDGVTTVRDWLAGGPLGLDRDQLSTVQDEAVSGLQSVAPTLATGVLTGASTAASLLTGTLFALVAVFFMLKDGSQMWAWLLSWVPARHRDRTDGAGGEAWSALTGYVRGTVIIALTDAVLIGVALLIVGVPLWLPLALLTFVAAFVPIVGAVVAGVLAILVTLVTVGPTAAVVILVVVLLVQNVEGEILQPLVMGQALRLHPLAILTTVTCATLLLGIAGAVIAVPLVGAGYKVASYLAGRGQQEEELVEELAGADG